MTTEIDRSAQMIYAKRVAREEGLAEGRVEGIEQGKLEIARNMKAAGIAAAIISQCTGLPLEQVVEL